MRIFRGALAAVAVLGSVVAPEAGAEPQFPDLDGFTAVDAEGYRTYSAYMTTGWQFATPGGVLCRIQKNSRAGFASLACWGAFPGVAGGESSIELDKASAPSAPVFAKSDRQGYGYKNLGLPGKDDLIPLAKKDYPVLAPGQKIVAAGAGAATTCAVGDGGLTVCQMEKAASDNEDGWRHGFVLSPEGSWTF
ncbi:MAG: hypothetical protein ACRC20_02840 [Segniliparus sp.]|uniref:hypothetical protein n=1 Tax=Segniliparus sp. TaxID=2804064 RepID=UPI003F2AB1AB